MRPRTRRILGHHLFFFFSSSSCFRRCNGRPFASTSLSSRRGSRGALGCSWSARHCRQLEKAARGTRDAAIRDGQKPAWPCRSRLLDASDIVDNPASTKTWISLCKIEVLLMASTNRELRRDGDDPFAPPVVRALGPPSGPHRLPRLLHALHLPRTDSCFTSPVITDMK